MPPDPIPVDSGCVTYESVLLTNSNHSNPPPYIHKTTSYAQIDAMLDKMLQEVEQQEKLFSLDLDIVENDDDGDSCVNTLELHPSTDALIEIPIKKSIRLPKMYETTHAIILDENPYELVQFGEDTTEKKSVNEYDLISFDDIHSTNTSLNKLQESVNMLLENVQQDEIELLLTNEQLHDSDYKSPLFFANIHTASSESLSDVSLDENWDDDYEPIDSPAAISNYPYELYGNNSETKMKTLYNNRDIWWEGTYRNLSVVPEEDEENISLIGTYSNKSIELKTLLDNNESNRSSYFSAKDDSNSSESSSNSEQLNEKIVKAEVKLLVKTLDRGKEAIEIRSVREFMEEPKKEFDCSKTRTLPSRFVENTEQYKKRGSEPCLLYSNEKSIKIPSFTLQRVFVRTPDSEQVKTIGNNSKDNTKTRPELVPIPTKSYPLQCGNAGYEPLVNQTEPQPEIDLFANTPFYPCYKKNTSKVISKSNSSTIPKAYCDWMPEFGVSYRGNVILNNIFRDKLIRMDFMDFVVSFETNHHKTNDLH